MVALNASTVTTIPVKVRLEFSIAEYIMPPTVIKLTAIQCSHTFSLAMFAVMKPPTNIITIKTGMPIKYLK